MAFFPRLVKRRAGKRRSTIKTHCRIALFFAIWYNNTLACVIVRTEEGRHAGPGAKTRLKVITKKAYLTYEQSDFKTYGKYEPLADPRDL